MAWQDKISGGFDGWQSYYTEVLGNPPRETTMIALNRWEAAHNRPGTAIDLGCGEGRDTIEFLRRGWWVLAIDTEPAAFDLLTTRADLPDAGHLEVRQVGMEALAFPAADIVNASFALPWCPPDRFGDLWARIMAALRPQGRFAGQFFGPNDSWADPELTILDRDTVEDLFIGFSFDHFDEIDRDGADAKGEPKHWHLFEVVAEKR